MKILGWICLAGAAILAVIALSDYHWDDPIVGAAFYCLGGFFSARILSSVLKGFSIIVRKYEEKD